MPTPPAPSGTAEPHAVVVQGLTKVYPTGGEPVRALDGVDVSFARGAFTAIMGPSGSGKSTLMHCMAGLDTPTSGSVRLGATELTALSDKQLTLLRRDRIGFVFQSFNLLPMLTARQNILLPSQISKRKVDPERFRHIVEVTGLADRLEHLPAKLSGGQQQRVAVARALVGSPEVLYADEPTGNLDSRSGAEVLSFLRDSVRELGQTIVMVTHDPIAASYADRVVFLRDGRVVDDVTHPTPQLILDRLAGLEG
ncbi:ABC transporter ATP-binding protein [Thermobifida fusca]|uniref:ABC-type antimicrobial peptide transport system ATPase component n=1 Tax=Thermobifida fusca (strain YX) TaxID=269800 RepID=Q47NT9_THEFY|nr:MULTISPECIES: ABC transporter ATP-binding protein [Thermobifida]AAZ55880.1 ABC-type antimicrobial peptide transport system ATPase component [Thermobifida fusca YX]MBO2530762.1 ABC transporter ATP-binding protein [Thermobifida sp.]MDD6791754.1 ABC transporter ATP-binding protein [Thermobifida fusca]PPS93526.1 ABC transporter [Thermobifida fusca]PZN62357.1 MAG: ABC transporter ATP-binding protein [Thermobifida fusca]